MNIMLIEDNDAKRQRIVEHLVRQGVSSSRILVAKTMTDFAAKLGIDIGLYIIDLKLPNVDGSDASMNGKAILEAIVKAGRSDALLVAISSYPNDFPELRSYYESHGCILANYNNAAAWQSTLNHLLVQLKKSVSFDFAVFCALQKERNPYVALLNGTQVARNGVDCFDVQIGDAKGTVVLLPQMGLVNAAIIAAQCIERFNPRVVGMSGICGGFKGRAQLGQLLVSSMAYEYQSGRWSADGFEQETYQIPTDPRMLARLKTLTLSNDVISGLEVGFSGDRPDDAQKPELAVFASGSAVVAEGARAKEIQRLHRKSAGLDMEIFAVHRAAELSPLRPPCICAKTVVDFCDRKKSDVLHGYGAHVSARFVIRALQDFFVAS